MLWGIAGNLTKRLNFLLIFQIVSSFPGNFREFSEDFPRIFDNLQRTDVYATLEYL